MTISTNDSGRVSTSNPCPPRDSLLLFARPIAELGSCHSQNADAELRIYLNRAKVFRRAAQQILESRYAYRGYQCPEPADEASLIPFLACVDGMPVGTLSVRFDSPRGLSCESRFAAVVAMRRRQGSTLCEFTRFAVDPGPWSRAVVAALFHTAFIAAHRVMRCDHVLIEVNPRHAGYYERCIGFRSLGEHRCHEEVGAPAVLMQGDLHDMDASYALACAGWQQGSRPGTVYAFSREQDRDVTHRLSTVLNGLNDRQANLAGGQHGSRRSIARWRELMRSAAVQHGPTTVF